MMPVKEASVSWHPGQPTTRIRTLRLGHASHHQRLALLPSCISRVGNGAIVSSLIPHSTGS